ncbi:MAG: malic enzyme-like NAD(P)-binding protein [Motiliproteus sp.]
MTKSLRQQALDYHALPTPGKIGTLLTTAADTAYDLSLAYSPGVAEPVKEIALNPEAAYQYTAKGNLVAVISNGSAILGLGNLGSLASKPVMEGKSLLFKRFAGIDSVDIEVDSQDPETFINTVVHIADTFGGINLEDIKAPECFEIERELITRCKIPVFHDDQHGTAIVTAAGLMNAVEIAGKRLTEVRIVCLGAGSAASAGMDLLKTLGVPSAHICMLDRQGVIYQGRNNLSAEKARFAIYTQLRTLDDALQGADVFIGLSGPNMLTPTMLNSMAPNPVVFACSNPDPEIQPALATATRRDVILATGRSDFPNQVNNVLGFPYIFRGALDVRASTINQEMKLAAVHAIANLAKQPVTQEVLRAYHLESLAFGPDYILPKATDARLLEVVSKAVSQAAIDSGVAHRSHTQGLNLSTAESLSSNTAI